MSAAQPPRRRALPLGGIAAPTLQPVFFGPVGATLFGWLHRPAGRCCADFGLVVCNPFGFEEVCAHRSLRRLACAAAAAGIAALRFDYAGCGNSCGDESDPHALKRWIDSVHEAIDTLERATGLPRVCLLGLRLGATLAALAAEQRSDIAGLVAIAPVVSGRAWLRELRLLGAPGAADGSLESAGFVLSGETCSALGTVDLRRLERAPAPRMLIVERDDLPIGDAWPNALARLGADVRCEHWPGYAAMVTDPQRAEVPYAIVDGVLHRLSRWRQPPPPRLRAALVGATATLCNVGGARVRESALWLDAGGARLFGVLTTPQAGHAPARAVVMLNAGSVHHIGPNRLWVRLARRWAARGVVVLRLDIAGIGDSPAARGGAENVVYPSHATRDIAAALAFLQREVGARELHLLGLCSGAYHAFKAAVAGQAVASAVVVNPLTFFWKEGMKLNVDLQDADTLQMTARYRRALWRSETWRRLLRWRLDLRTIGRAVARRAWDSLRHRGRELARTLHIMTHDDLAAELNAAAEHGTRIAFVFASGDPGRKLLELQGGRAVRRLLDQRRISIDLIDGADHTFTRAEARERLVAVLERLMFTPVSQPADGPAPVAPPLRSVSGVRGAQLP